MTSDTRTPDREPRTTRAREASQLRAEAKNLGRRNRLLREAIAFTAIPTLLIFADRNDGVRQAVADLRRALAESVR